ncbi:MAG: 2-hydroxyacid dehydrogenase [Inhella sp.]
MKLTVCVGEAGSAWVGQLRALLPDWQVDNWQPGDPPADVAVLWKPPPAFFAEQRDLRAAFAAGAGVDGLLALQPPPGLPIYRLEDAGMGVQMAEYVLAALLRWYRGFDAYERDAAAGRWTPRPPPRKADWPVGLLGCGLLAAPVIEALQHFGFPVQAWARRPRDGQRLPVFHGDAGLRALLAGSRVVVALLPLTEQTRVLLNAERLAGMPPGSYLINIARGALVDEAALLAALDRGQLAGAMLDVCRDEPATPEHPFWHHPRIQLTPHIAAATIRDEAAAQIAAKLRLLERAEAVGGRVGPEGY